MSQSQKGFVHLFLLFVIAFIIVGVYLVTQGKVKLPSIFEKKPKVELQTTYENPFKKETQFVNPFDTYKNPFVVNR